MSFKIKSGRLTMSSSKYSKENEGRVIQGVKKGSNFYVRKGMVIPMKMTDSEREEFNRKRSDARRRTARKVGMLGVNWRFG